MRDFNTVTLIGRLGKEVRTFGEGDKAGLSFSVANASSRKVDGAWVDSTNWVNVTVFGKQSAFLASKLNKGSKVLISGRFELREYEKDGQKHISVEIKADEVTLLDHKRADESKAPF